MFIVTNIDDVHLGLRMDSHFGIYGQKNVKDGTNDDVDAGNGCSSSMGGRGSGSGRKCLSDEKGLCDGLVKSQAVFGDSIIGIMSELAFCRVGIRGRHRTESICQLLRPDQWEEQDAEGEEARRRKQAQGKKWKSKGPAIIATPHSS